jgi:hypothetical protein
MREFTWSATEKKAARAAFDRALTREVKAARQEAEAMTGISHDWKAAQQKVAAGNPRATVIRNQKAGPRGLRLKRGGLLLTHAG